MVDTSVVSSVIVPIKRRQARGYSLYPTSALASIQLLNFEGYTYHFIKASVHLPTLIRCRFHALQFIGRHRRLLQLRFIECSVQHLTKIFDQPVHGRIGEMNFAYCENFLTPIRRVPFFELSLSLADARCAPLGTWVHPYHRDHISAAAPPPDPHSTAMEPYRYCGGRCRCTSAQSPEVHRLMFHHVSPHARLAFDFDHRQQKRDAVVVSLHLRHVNEISLQLLFPTSHDNA